MSQIDRIVDINITRETTQIDIAAFDIPLLLVGVNLQDLPMTERVQTFTTLKGVADVFGVGHVAHTMSQKLLSGDIRPSTWKIAYVGYTPAVEEEEEDDIQETYAEALNAAMEADDTWYALLADSHQDGDILSLAAIIQAQRRMYFTSSSNPQILASEDSSDVASVLQASGYFRTALLYSANADTAFPEAAWVGSQLPEIPGSNTWEYKQLAGVPVSKLSDTNITVLESKDANYYISAKGVSFTRRGVSTDGSWIDEINNYSLLAA